MLSMPVSDATPLRSDARRNLERILEAARLSFAEHGLEVGVEAIARRAGVGKATFFRRFPSKDALVVAVFEGFIADLEELAQQTAAMDDPWEGLRCFMVQHARMQADNAGFFDAVAARFSEGQLLPEEAFDRVTAAVETALAPARDAGLIRAGVGAGDVITMLKMIGPAIRPMSGVRLEEATWTRYVELLLSGIRAGQEPLPGVALDVCEIARRAGRLSA
jgi:AcrR family transcriptional regulator